MTSQEMPFGVIFIFISLFLFFSVLNIEPVKSDLSSKHCREHIPISEGVGDENHLCQER